MAHNKELGLTGPGVAPVRIKQLDKLAREYIVERDKRLVLTPREVAAKQRLIEAMHSHAKELRLPDGTLVYHYDETLISLIPGKEKLKVEAVDLDEEEDD
jgi:hypothetical protein